MNPLKVVIPSRTASNLWPCIQAVRTHDPGLEIIVVDDGVCWELYENRWKNLTVIGGRKPFAFPVNANIGIRAAGDADVILLNDDALLESDGGFRLLQAAAHQHPEYGIIGAVTNLTGQPLQWPMLRGDHRGLREVEHIAFVCVLIPLRTRQLMDGRSVWASWVHIAAGELLTRGLLDERYCLDYGVDDRDYCEQVRHCGLKVGVHDGCFVDHASLHSSYRGNPEAPGSFQRNLELFKQKWGMSEVR